MDSLRRNNKAIELLLHGVKIVIDSIPRLNDGGQRERSLQNSKHSRPLGLRYDPRLAEGYWTHIPGAPGELDSSFHRPRGRPAVELDEPRRLVPDFWISDRLRVGAADQRQDGRVIFEPIAGNPER